MSDVMPATKGGISPISKVPSKPHRASFRAFMAANWMYYAMLMPAAILLVLFHFYPIWGISMAFVDYSPYKGMAGSPFVGLQNFQRLIEMPEGAQVLRNTLVIAIGKIVVGQISAIIFALLLHEISNPFFKRMMQTWTTLPHFMSWIVVGGILLNVLSSSIHDLCSRLKPDRNSSCHIRAEVSRTGRTAPPKAFP